MKRLLTLLLVLASVGAYAEDLVLENNHAKLVFDGDSKAFCIKNFFMEGMDIAASETTPPWEIELLGPRDELALLKPGMAFYEGGSIKHDTAQFKWLIEHCWDFGFILRYPKDKTNVTGIAYESWHYRYVGEEAAKIIHDNNWTLEEYCAARK